MSTVTKIEWTDRTWNCIRGCSLVSDGCKNCYAMKQAHRFSGPGKPYEGLTELGPQGPRWTGKVRLVPELLDEPLRWKKPCRIFVNSMSDLFHEDVPEEFIDQVFAVMALTPQHTYQVLTKRPARLHAYCIANERADRIAYAACALGKSCYELPRSTFDVDHNDDGKIEAVQAIWPLPNCWKGVSIENQPTADERIPILLRTPAAVRWVSYEPALGAVDFGKWFFGDERPYDVPVESLNWIVCGGESGPKARCLDVRWIRRTVRQCRAAKVPVFVKQLGASVWDRNDAEFDGCSPGAWPDGTETDDWDKDPSRQYQGAETEIMLKDRKGGDPDEWPEDLRIRQYPAPERGMR